MTLRRQGRNFASGDARSPGHRPHALQVTLHQGRFLHSLPMTLCQGRWPHPLPVTLCQGRWRYSLQVTLCHRGEKRLHGYRQLTHPCSFLPLACRPPSTILISSGVRPYSSYIAAISASVSRASKSWPLSSQEIKRRRRVACGVSACSP